MEQPLTDQTDHPPTALTPPATVPPLVSVEPAAVPDHPPTGFESRDGAARPQPAHPPGHRKPTGMTTTLGRVLTRVRRNSDLPNHRPNWRPAGADPWPRVGGVRATMFHGSLGVPVSPHGPLALLQQLSLGHMSGRASIIATGAREPLSPVRVQPNRPRSRHRSGVGEQASGGRCQVASAPWRFIPRPWMTGCLTIISSHCEAFFEWTGQSV